MGFMRAWFCISQLLSLPGIFIEFIPLPMWAAEMKSHNSVWADHVWGNSDMSLSECKWKIFEIVWEQCLGLKGCSGTWSTATGIQLAGLGHPWGNIPSHFTQGGTRSAPGPSVASEHVPVVRTSSLNQIPINVWAGGVLWGRRCVLLLEKAPQLKEAQGVK